MGTPRGQSISHRYHRFRRRLSLKKIFRWLCFLTARLRQLFIRVEQLQDQAGLITQLQSQVNASLGTISQVQTQLVDVLAFIGPLIALRTELSELVGQTATIQVGGTAITGTVQVVGTNYVQVQEQTDNLVFIPIANIEGIV